MSAPQGRGAVNQKRERSAWYPCRMHRASRLLLIGVLAASTGASCIPTNDNPFDPVRVPRASLALRDLGNAQPCPAASAGDGVASSLVSRGHCLLLDASASSDPQDKPIHFRFAIRDTAGSGAFATLVESTSSVAVIAPTELRTHPIAQALEIRVEVINAGGSVGSASSPLVLSDALPIAKAPPLLHLPTGGFPWNPSASYSIVFDGGFTDADGDPPLYCWDAQPCSASPLSPAVQVSSGVPSRLVAALRIDDGANLSATSYARAEVGEPALWRFGGYSTTGVELVDGDFRTLGGQVIDVAEIHGSVPRILVAYFWPPTFQTFLTVVPETNPPPLPTPTSTSPTELPPPGSQLLGSPIFQVRMETNATGNAAYVRFVGFGSDFLARFTIDAQGNLTGPDTSVAENPESPNPLYHPNPLLVAADGTVWDARFDTLHNDAAPRADVVAWDPSLTVAVGSDLPAGTVLMGMALRPGTNDAWSLETEDFLRPSPFPRLADLVRRRVTGGSIQTTRYPLSIAEAGGLAFTAPGELWTWTHDFGLVRLDPAILEGGGSLLDAINLAVPEVLATFVLTPDARTHEIWAVGTGTTAWRVRPDGEVDSFHVADGAATGGEPRFVDESGLLWDLRGRIERSLALDGVVSVSDPGFLLAGEVDSATGGAWFVSDLPASLLHYAADGSAIEQIAEGRVDGVLSPLPAWLPFSVSPDGRYAVGARGGPNAIVSIDWIDLTVRPIDVTSIKTLGGVPSGGSAVVPFAVSAPVPGSSPFLWYSFGTNEIDRLDGVGTPLPPFVLGTSLYTGQTSAARVPRDNALFVGTKHYPDDALAAFWIASNGIGVALPQITVPDIGEMVPPVSVSIDVDGAVTGWMSATRRPANPDPCLGRVAHLVAWDRSGAIVHEVDVPGIDLESVAPRRRDDVWISGRDCASGYSRRVSIHLTGPQLQPSGTLYDVPGTKFLQP